MFIVTGANGFIGSALVWELNQQGITDICCTDTISLKERPELLKPLKYSSFLSAEELRTKLNDDNFWSDVECVFHMGACSATTETNWDYLKDNNTYYTEQLFETCKIHNIPFIYASSGAVYGPGDKGFDDKGTSEKFEPLNLYGKSKSMFDVWVEKQQHTPPRWYGLRFFNVYGPNEYHKDDMSSVVFKAFGQINNTKSLKLFRSHNPDYEDGKQMRDFVYVKDITRWMYELYKNEKVESGIYNLGYGKARTWLDLANAVFETMGEPVKINWIDVPENIRDHYQYFTEADISKLKAQGLSEPQWSLEKGVRDYVGNYLMKDDPHLY